MSEPLQQSALEQLFLAARTPNVWTDRPVSDDTIRRLYELLRMAPTSANASPARFVWVKSAEGKQTLADLAFDNNKARIYEPKEMDADHVTAWSKGGGTDPSNLTMLCKPHNQAKGNR